jgi:excisionase family DNA binding protein
MHATRSPELLRIPETAERLNVSRASVYRWITEGRLPAVRLGDRGGPLRVRAEELDEWLEERRTSTDVSERDGSRQGQLKPKMIPPVSSPKKIPMPSPKR